MHANQYYPRHPNSLFSASNSHRRHQVYIISANHPATATTPAAAALTPATAAAPLYGATVAAPVAAELVPLAAFVLVLVTVVAAEEEALEEEEAAVMGATMTAVVVVLGLAVAWIWPSVICGWGVD